MPTAPDEIVAIPAGEVRLRDYDESLMMDAKAAALIIEAFKDQGVDLPVDYEHSSVYEADEGRPAPAIGWIHELRWQEGRGLIARVCWGEEAAEYIARLEYKYLSPVIEVDEDTQRPTYLHSVGLTNKPRIIDQKEIMAAADKVLAQGHNERTDNMSVKTKEKKTRKRVRLAAAELDGVPVDAASPEDEAVVEDVGASIGFARDALTSWGVDVPEDAGPDVVLQLAVDLLVRLFDEVTASEDAAPVEEVIAETEDAVAASDKPAKAVKLIRRLLAARDDDRPGFVPVEQFTALSERLTKLEAKEAASAVDKMLAHYLHKHKLNAYDEKQMLWAREAARKDPDGFKRIMANAPVIVEPGKNVSGKYEGDPDADPRKRMIVSAKEEWQSSAKLRGMVPKVDAYVNAELRTNGMALLSEEERKTMVA